MLIFQIMWRRKLLITCAAVAFSAAAIAGTRTITPSFVASASILMQERPHSVLDIPTASGLVAIDSLAVRTQTDVLRSADLARSVVRKLHLIDEPEFAPHPSLINYIMQKAGLAAPNVAPTEAELEDAATQKLLNMITVINDGRSYVIEIRVKVNAPSVALGSHAANLSADLTNAIADAYIQLTQDIKSNSIRKSKSFFDHRLEELQQKMRAAQEAVQLYRSRTGLIENRSVGTPGKPVSMASQQLGQLNADLATATADRVLKEASLQQIKQAGGDIRKLRAVPEVVASPLIQRLREQQITLAAREAELATTHSGEWPELAAVRSSLRGVSAAIDAEIAKIAASLDSGATAARAREAALTAQLGRLQGTVSTQGESEIKLLQLENAAETARSIYASFLKRSEESANEVDAQEPDALILSAARVPQGPAAPSSKQLAALGVIASFVLATLMALVLERMKSGFRTSEELEAATGIATLGLVPKTRRVQRALLFKEATSLFSENVSAVRAALRLNCPTRARVVMVTSALPREGKTIFSSALARNAAMAGERTLLIDCDLRRPMISRTIFNERAEFLDGAPESATWNVRRDRFSPLYIIELDLGKQRPQDLLAAAPLQDLIASVRNRFDLIVLDTPPVLAVNDALVLSSLADATVLVVHWLKTPKKLVKSALSALRKSGANIVGTVITQVKYSNLTSSDDVQGYVYRKYPQYMRIEAGD
jgi:capsular exopolysaccharide synthesis family protein